jgi:transcription-repair coupling factor (superfamily II helicase)
VALRLDFLAFSPEESLRPEPRAAGRGGGPEEEGESNVPEFGAPLPAPLRTIAYLPLNYIEAAQARIEIYRKIAQITDKGSAEALRQELRDRFGPLPAAVELLIQVMQLKVLAAEKRVTMIETRGAKLMLTRNQDYIMVGGRFPRLVKKEAKARLQEIKKVLLALQG